MLNPSKAHGKRKEIGGQIGRYIPAPKMSNPPSRRRHKQVERGQMDETLRILSHSMCSSPTPYCNRKHWRQKRGYSHDAFIQLLMGVCVCVCEVHLYSLLQFVCPPPLFISCSASLFSSVLLFHLIISYHIIYIHIISHHLTSSHIISYLRCKDIQRLPPLRISINNKKKKKKKQLKCKMNSMK